MYRLAGESILNLPKEMTSITLVPPADDSDVVWEQDWITRKMNRSLDRLTRYLWIPSMYLEPSERKGCDELLVFRNGGRCSDTIIPQMDLEYETIRYKMNVLNCKGTGVNEASLKETGKTSIEYRNGFSICNSVISRQSHISMRGINYGAPRGGITTDSALRVEVRNEQMMLDNGLAHAPYVMVTKIPDQIQKRIDKYNAENIYKRPYSEESFGENWAGGGLAQVKRLFTTNIRMNRIRDASFPAVVKKESELEWLRPENLAGLIGRCDGKYKRFLDGLAAKGRFVNFIGTIKNNRTIDGLLVDGENFEPVDRVEDNDLRRMFDVSRKFILRYSGTFGMGQDGALNAVEAYNDTLEDESVEDCPMSIPK
jgi:hypothetical protein